MREFDNEQDRYGSSGFAEPEHIPRSYFNQTPDSVFVGYVNGRALYWHGMGGLALTAGPRSGKLRDILSYNIINGMYAGTLLVLDLKGELAAISRLQTIGRKFCIYWNPPGLHGLPQNRINPVGYIRIDSPTLVSDVKVLCENLISLKSSGNNGDFFPRRAREFMEGIILTIVKMDGVLTLPRLYEIINLIPTGSERWLDFAFEMSEAGFGISKRVEEEIAQSRGDSSGGFRGIVGEIFKSVAALSDPTLMASVSPPYDFTLDQLCSSDQAYNFYMMVPAEFIEAWGPIVKAILVGAMFLKSRAPAAPRQTWLLDECGQLGSFPLIAKLYTYGAGIGIRPWTVWQTTKQMNGIVQDGETIITASAAVRSYFAIRDGVSATALSNMIGKQTLEYDDELAHSRAALAKKEAVRAVLGGADPIEEGIKLRHHNQAIEHRSKKERLLRTPDEVMNTPDGKQYIFMDGVPYCIYADRKPYYEQRSLAGKFHPNPYHPPLDRVRVKSFIWHRWRQIINEPVPSEYAHYPQYADGTWSYVEGYR